MESLSPGAFIASLKYDWELESKVPQCRQPQTAHLLKELSRFYLSLQNHTTSLRTRKVANVPQDSMLAKILWPQGEEAPGRSWHPNASGRERLLPGLQRSVRRIKQAVWMTFSPPLLGRVPSSMSFWKGPAGLYGPNIRPAAQL